MRAAPSMDVRLAAGLAGAVIGATEAYNRSMERKIFWMVFTVLGLLADFLLPFWWAVGATIPLLFVAWWIAYRSDWF
jgi:hypothetical protein